MRPAITAVRDLLRRATCKRCGRPIRGQQAWDTHGDVRHGPFHPGCAPRSARFRDRMEIK